METEHGRGDEVLPEPFDIKSEFLTWAALLKPRLSALEAKYGDTIRSLRSELGQLRPGVAEEEKARSEQPEQERKTNHAIKMKNPLTPNKPSFLRDPSKQKQRYETLSSHLGFLQEMQTELTEVGKNPVALLGAATTAAEFNQMVTDTESRISRLEEFLS